MNADPVQLYESRAQQRETTRTRTDFQAMRGKYKVKIYSFK